MSLSRLNLQSRNQILLEGKTSTLYKRVRLKQRKGRQTGEGQDGRCHCEIEVLVLIGTDGEDGELQTTSDLVPLAEAAVCSKRAVAEVKGACDDRAACALGCTRAAQATNAQFMMVEVKFRVAQVDHDGEAKPIMVGAEIPCGEPGVRALPAKIRHWRS